MVSTKPEDKEATEQKIVGLRQALQEAEMTAALEGAMATMHGVLTSSDKATTELGPTVNISVRVNGVSTEALVDTGSPGHYHVTGVCDVSPCHRAIKVLKPFRVEECYGQSL